MSDQPEIASAIDELAVGDVQAIRRLNAIPLERRTDIDKLAMALELMRVLSELKGQHAAALEIAEDWGVLNVLGMPSIRGIRGVADTPAILGMLGISAKPPTKAPGRKRYIGHKQQRDLVAWAARFLTATEAAQELARQEWLLLNRPHKRPNSVEVEKRARTLENRISRAKRFVGPQAPDGNWPPTSLKDAVLPLPGPPRKGGRL